MVRSTKRLIRFEAKLFRATRSLSLRKRIQIYRAMWEEVTKLGILRSKNPLAGIEKDIQLAKVLNSCLRKS